MKTSAQCFFALLILCGTAWSNPDILPLQDGNVWYYSYTFATMSDDYITTSQPIYVTGSVTVNDTLYHEIRRPDNYWWYARQDENGNVYFRNPGYEEQLYYCVDAEIGEKWQCELIYLWDPQSPMTFEITMESKSDSITTEAGTFTECYRYKVECLTMTDWIEYDILAPGIGKVMRYSDIFVRTEETLLKAHIDDQVKPDNPQIPTVTWTLPEDGETGIPVDTDVITTGISFYIKPDTITEDAIEVVSRSRGNITGTVTQEFYRYNTRIHFYPDTPFLADEVIDVTVSGELEDYMGATLAEPYQFSFSTGSGPITEVHEELRQFDLSSYPNPFNPRGTITYTLTEASQVTLSVYNVSGQKVTTLVDDFLSAGSHNAVFDGSGLSSGVYFYRCEAAGAIMTGKMVLMK